MEYVDTGSRDPTQALGTWLGHLDVDAVCAVRWQSGYFNVGGLAPLVPLLRNLVKRDLQVSCVLGSNNGETVRKDLEVLANLIGGPRPAARIAVVKYETGLYHPKVYHVTRMDGSQAAFVGSANLTQAGVTGLNIEAGIILDSASGDSLQLLEKIASAVDAWFEMAREGVTRVASSADISKLVAEGAIRDIPTPKAQRLPPGSTSGAATRARLKPLVKFPSLFDAPDTPGATPEESTEPAADVAPPTLHAPTPRDGFPPYLLFAPGATAPTRSGKALSGAMLPGGVPGLIVRLNRDSVRHFEERSGTANISLPIPTLGTIQFGIYRRTYLRPRAEFPLRARYVSPAGVHIAPQKDTNIMPYGHDPKESGHTDVRMLLSASPARSIREFAVALGLPVPQVHHPMILEWPTQEDPSFRATFVDPNMGLFSQLQEILASALENDELVGKSACWLPPFVAPSWSQQA